MQWAIAHVVECRSALSRFNFSDCERFSPLNSFRANRTATSHFGIGCWQRVRARTAHARNSNVYNNVRYPRSRETLFELFIHIPLENVYTKVRLFESSCAPHGFFVNFAYVSSRSEALISKQKKMYLCECHGCAFECCFISYFTNEKKFSSVGLQFGLKQPAMHINKIFCHDFIELF